MKPFIVRLYCESSVKLDKPFHFKVSGQLLEIHDLLSEAALESHPTGNTWEWTAQLSSETASSALNEAQGYATYVSDVLALNEGAAVGEARALVAIDVDETEDDRTFAQPLYPDFGQLGSRRHLNPHRLRSVYSHLARTDPITIRPRLDRALHLYRRSLVDTDPLDGFQDLWSGLEALNPLLRDKYATHRKYPQPCPNCHDPLICRTCGNQSEQVDTSSGIRYAVCDLLGREDEWPGLRRTRVSIVHSLEHEIALEADLPKKLELLRAAFVQAFLALIDYTEPDSEFLEPPLPLSSVPRLMMTGQIHHMPASQVKDMLPLVPHFSAVYRQPDVPLDQKVPYGIIREASVAINPQGFSNQYSFRLLVTARRGPRDEGFFGASFRQDSPGGSS